MGLFSRKPEAETSAEDGSRNAADGAAPILDVFWFKAWMEKVCRGVPPTAVEATEMLGKVVQVVDHECIQYVDRYCDAQARERYRRFVRSDGCTPWALIALATELNRDPKWSTFIVTGLEPVLNRFADIILDPSIVE